jgi:hypothetical protein
MSFGALTTGSVDVLWLIDFTSSDPDAQNVERSLEEFSRSGN